MRAPSPTARLWRRSGFRVGVIGVVLMGYALGLAHTSIGQGWTLLAHLASIHSSQTYVAPQLYAEDALLPAQRTIRYVAHSHGTAGAHHHRTHATPAPLAPEASEPWRQSRVPAPAPPLADAGFHEHGGEMHRHDAPSPDSVPTVIVSLDKHRLPLADALAPLLVRDVEWSIRGETLASEKGQVETPPPLA